MPIVLALASFVDVDPLIGLQPLITCEKSSYETGIYIFDDNQR